MKQLIARACSYACLLPCRYHPRFQALLAWAKIYRESISLGRFGAQTRKPIHLFSNLPYISELPALYSHTSAEVPQSTGVVFRFLGDDGTVKVTGAALLKNTQAYPPNFGMALAQVYEEHRRDIKKAAELQRFQQVREVKNLRSPLFGSVLDFVSDSPLCEDIWEDAALKPVFESLQSETLHKLVASHGLAATAEEHGLDATADVRGGPWTPPPRS